MRYNKRLGLVRNVGWTKAVILGKNLPLQIASQVFAAEATSRETGERIASKAGIYYSKRRNSFKPETVKKMIFLQGCFLQDMPQCRRAKVANERVEEFIKKQAETELRAKLTEMARPRPSLSFLMDCDLGFIMMTIPSY